MGHWILEVTKIGVYIGIPLSSFVIFNSPSFYGPVLYEWRKKNQEFAENDEYLKKIDEAAIQALEKIKIRATKSKEA